MLDWNILVINEFTWVNAKILNDTDTITYNNSTENSQYLLLEKILLERLWQNLKNWREFKRFMKVEVSSHSVDE